MISAKGMSSHQPTSLQAGFSLLEVLVAMFIAAVAVVGVMALHVRHLSQVGDNVQLMRAQMILTNAAARSNFDANLNQTMADEAESQKMTGVAVTSANLIVTGQLGRLLTIQWANHDADTQVWRCPLSGVPAVVGRSCLELWVLP